MERNLFLKKYGQALEEGRAAIFAGAGLSVGAGFVDWKGLLKDVATELKLQIRDYTNLVDLAQYYVNQTKNASELSSSILNAFPSEKEPTENHKILASLPITTYWTTNFDKLIEKSLQESGKIYDTKSLPESLAISKNRAQATIYKMHGDVDNPVKTILTRDQFENYPQTHKAFLDSLGYDLTNKTFLFLGLSFDDPNLRSVLKYTRLLYHENQRRHYYILKQISRQENESEESYSYRSREQELFVDDLRNYGVETVLIDEYNEITEILTDIKKRYMRRTIFISGAAAKYEPYGEKEFKLFLQKLAASLIHEGFRIVSGYGLGFGNEILAGAITQLRSEHKPIDGNFMVYPFPQGIDNPKEAWHTYRKEMIRNTGVSVFLLGNKIGDDGKVIHSNGMQDEYNISKGLGNYLIPVGATGSMSEHLWKDQKDNNLQIAQTPSKEDMCFLGDKSKTLDELHDKIISILKQLTTN